MPPITSSSLWTNLPPDLLKIIADDHLDITSSVRLSLVCKSWASTILPHLPSLPPIDFDKPIPWLLLYARQNSKIGRNNTQTFICTDFTFYDISTANIYNVPINIPPLQGQRLLGSHKGWLITADPPSKRKTTDSIIMSVDATSKVQLIKPLIGSHVSLPSVNENFESFKKAIMSDNNIDQLPFIFCLTKIGSLWMTKVASDDSWTPLCITKNFMDIIFYQGKLFATSWDSLFYYNPENPSDCQLMTKINYNVPHVWMKYLFEWKGELFVLLINGMCAFGSHYFPPREVMLYKLNLTDAADFACPLIKVTSLGNNALFFNYNCSYVLPASTSGSDGIRENCIYFTDEVSSCPCHDAKGHHPNHNFVVYNFEDKTITPLCPHSSLMHTTQPIFFSPC